MFKKGILLCGLAMLMGACYKFNAPERPENLIPKDKMIQILMDSKLISNGVTGYDKKVLDSLNVTVDSYIFEKYAIDSAQFAQSNTYYAYHLDDYQYIYEVLKDTLGKLKEYYKEEVELEKKAKKIQDSLKALEKKKDTLALKTAKKNTKTTAKGLIAPVSDTP